MLTALPGEEGRALDDEVRTRGSRFVPDDGWQRSGAGDMTLAIHRERTAEGFLVRFVGEFDPRMSGAITQAILSTAESSVVVDVSDLHALDGRGVGALVEARDRLAVEGKGMRVLGADADLLRAIESSPLSRPIGPTDEPSGLGLHGNKQGRGIRQG